MTAAGPEQAALFADTHAHLDGYGTELVDVIARAKQAGVMRIVAVGVDAHTSRHAMGLVQASLSGAHAGQPELALVAGLHPHYASAAAAQMPLLRELMTEAIAGELPVAVGEIGLDYYRNRSPHAAQRASFWAQLELAHEYGLPVVVHDRDAHSDVLAVLRGAAPLPAGGVMHCYSGDLRLAEAAIDLGMHISFAGPVTYANAGATRELAARLPLERLLVETDCPYLAPVPHRGKRNEPALVAYTAQAVAKLRPEGELAALAALWHNAGEVFFGKRSGGR